MLRWLTRAVLALIALAVLATGVALWRYASYAPADPPIAPDAKAQAWFIDDYAPARLACLDQARALAGRFERVEQFAIPVASAQTKDLFVDGRYVPAQRAPKRLLIL